MKSLRTLIDIIPCRKAAAAVEFAIAMPLFVVLVFGVIIYGAYFAVVHGVEQLAAEAARASISGLSDQERASLAQTYVSSNIGAYPLLNAAKLSFNAAPSAANPNVFVVTLSYDASSLFIYMLPTFVPAPPSTITEAAAINRGGF
jgi:Flp pilus assembly protein TadG